MADVVSAYDPAVLYIHHNSIYIQDTDYINPGTISFTFDIYGSAMIYKHYPVSLLTGLSRLGGIFFMFSLASGVFHIVHLFSFQASVSRFMRSKPPLSSGDINLTTNISGNDWTEDRSDSY